MTKLLIAGDTHGDIAHIDYLADIAKEHEVDGVVQLGDFGYTFTEDFIAACHALTVVTAAPLWWLAGNHDDANHIDFRLHDVVDTPVPLWPEAPNVLYVPRGMTWNVGETRFMGLGGAVSIDMHHRTPNVSWWPQEAVTDADVARAEAAGVVDVMFTHDAPVGVNPLELILPSLRDRSLERSCTANRRRVAMAVEACKPRLLFHGHYHYRYDGMWRAGNGRQTQVVGLGCNGQGEDSWQILSL